MINKYRWGIRMPYCPKCGNDVDETMAFCPKCGTALNSTMPNQEANNSVKEEKLETHKNTEEAEIHQRSDYGFIGYLMGGFILIVLGVFAVLDLSYPFFASTETLAIMLITIGAIIIIGAVFMTTPVRKYFKQIMSHPKKDPAKI
jgi:hypothetical protein